MMCFKVICSCCKSSGCSICEHLSLLRCLVVYFQWGVRERRLSAHFREPEDLLLPIYARYKWIFALKGAWRIKNRGGTSLNSPLNTPQHHARNDGVKQQKEVLLCF